MKLLCSERILLLNKTARYNYNITREAMHEKRHYKNEGDVLLAKCYLKC